MRGAALEIPERSKHATSKTVENAKRLEGVLRGREDGFIRPSRRAAAIIRPRGQGVSVMSNTRLDDVSQSIVAIRFFNNDLNWRFQPNGVASVQSRLMPRVRPGDFHRNSRPRCEVRSSAVARLSGPSGLPEQESPTVRSLDSQLWNSKWKARCAAVRVEVRWIQPALECRLSFRPFRVEHREPSCIAIASLDDHMLTKDSLEREAQPQSRCTRRRIQRVALPFITPVSQIFKNMPSHQVHRFSRSNRPLQTGRIEDAANLDHPMRRLDTQVGGLPNRISGRLVENGKEQRIFRSRLAADIGIECRSR